MSGFKILVAAALISQPEAAREFDDLTALYRTSLVFAPSSAAPHVLAYTSFESGEGQLRDALLHRKLAPALQHVAVTWEILDRRETGYLLAEAALFAPHLQELHDRYARLRAAPPLYEADRFPARTHINELLSFNRQYRQDLLTRLHYDPLHGDEVRAALAETDELYRAWDTLRTARSGFCYVTVRREALQRFREVIGDAAFYTGELPPPVPMWRLPWKE